MGATTSEGIGMGAVTNKTPLNASGPHVVAAGSILVPGWKVTVTLPHVLPENASKYSVIAIQSDYTNNDGRPDHPAHIEKLDGEGNNRDNESNDWSADGMSGFVLHSGDSGDREFMWVIVRNGFGI